MEEIEALVAHAATAASSCKGQETKALTQLRRTREGQRALCSSTPEPSHLVLHLLQPSVRKEHKEGRLLPVML